MGTVVAVDVGEALLELEAAEIIRAEDDLENVYRQEHVDPDIDVFVLGPRLADPIKTARRIGMRFKTSGILILIPPEREEAHGRALRFAPLISRHVRSYRVDRPEEIAAKVEQMIVEARQRRKYGAFLESVRGAIPSVEGEQPRTELFLDVLLDHVPIGVFLVDDEGHVLDINAEAGRLIGAPIAHARGNELRAVFRKQDHAAVERVLERARERPDRPQSVLLTTGGQDAQRVVELTASRPSDAGRTFGTLLMLQDVTDRLAAQRAAAELQKQRAVASALERQSDELRRLNEEFERSNLELQEFAYVASHDLQEPLRKIVSFADLLLQDHAEELTEDAAHIAERLQSAARRMSALIRGLLEFSRVRTRQFEFDMVDLNGVMEDVMSDLAIAIEEADADIAWSDLPHIEADESEMLRLLENLIRNSLTYRKQTGKARIRVTSEPASHHGRDGYRIEVKDNGIGFDNRFVDKIFSPYQRLHAGSEFEGTGMGLAICRRIVERHGGTISAEGRPGQGAIFTIDLPARREPV